MGIRYITNSDSSITVESDNPAEGIENLKRMLLAVNEKRDLEAPVTWDELGRQLQKDHFAAAKKASQTHGKGGRPKELQSINGSQIIEARGRTAKKIFAQRCGISEETLAQAEENSLASKATLKKLNALLKSEKIVPLKPVKP